MSILSLGPQKMAPVPPFLNPGQHGWVEPSCTGSSGQLFPFSCSCCSLSDSPALYPCQRKTTAAPSPTTLPDHSIQCSDTPTALLHSEASRWPRASAGSRRGKVGPKQPQAVAEDGILAEIIIQWQLQFFIARVFKKKKKSLWTWTLSNMELVQYHLTL